MKVSRRIFALFLTAVVFVTAAYAGERGDADIAYAVTGGNIYFSKSSGTVTDCDNSVTETVIPAQIGGVSVTAIGYRAFDGCRGLTSVEIPNSVTSIGRSAFYNCRGLTSAEIPDSVTSIGESAFYGCSILTGVEIPNSVTFIGYGAFTHCGALTSVEIPDSVTFIGERAFAPCSSLTNIHIASGNQQYASVDGVLFDKSQTTLICYPGGKTGAYQIPNGVTSIGAEAFYYCRGLTNVEIPNGVTDIEPRAFCACSGLTSVGIPASVTSIGKWAFQGCGSLRDVYYSGSRAQWEAINGINNSELISREITIHYNASMPDEPTTPTTPEFTVPSAPTVGGHAIRKADLSGLNEISVPLSISGDDAVSVTVCVPFFDGAKFLGAPCAAVTADSKITSVTIPVTDNVSGAGRLNVIIADADFRPLCAAPFDIAA